MFIDLRLKIRDFIKRNKWKVLLFFIAWAILITISTILDNWENETPITTYTPYEPIIDNGETTPKKWQDDIEKIIDQYVSYCNQKEYQKAYEMIDESCRKKIYPTIDEFKAYVDYVFNEKKVYTIQNYSNRDNIYIYRIRLFEDILATGLTYSDSLKYFEEKLTFTEKNGNLLLGVKEYIADQEMDAVYEDEYMKITVTNKSIMYDSETYTVKIKNKTEHAIVLADDFSTQEIEIETKNGAKPMVTEGLLRAIYLPAETSSTYYLEFQNFYDEGYKATGIKFNSVRILRSYSGEEDKKEQELAEAVSLYSFTMPLN